MGIKKEGGPKPSHLWLIFAEYREEFFSVSMPRSDNGLVEVKLFIPIPSTNSNLSCSVKLLSHVLELIDKIIDIHSTLQKKGETLD